MASATTLLLLVLGTPIAWWLACTRSRWKRRVATLIALPLVPPPTVLGFYLLRLLGPHGPGGQLTLALGRSRDPATALRMLGWPLLEAAKRVVTGSSGLSLLMRHRTARTVPSGASNFAR